MRISITYLYAIFTYGYPPAVDDDFRALADIEKMGFHYLEMESLGPAHGELVWARRQEFKRRLDGHGIHVHNFCGVDPDLVSLDAQKRRQACARFGRTAELGAFLGAETLHLASYAPPVEYLGAAPYQLQQDYQFGNTFRVRIPEGFSWAAVWDALVDSCQQTADIAAQSGRTIIMEPRVGECICSVDSLRLLIRDVGRPNFKANFDTGHFCAQRENVCLALAKLEGQFANIHLSDNIPVNAEHLPPGRGVIDWPEFFRVLAGQGYQGYLGLDLGKSPTLVQDLQESTAFLRQCAAAQGIALES